MTRRVSDTSGRPQGSAKDRALRLLGVRWRSRSELERRLRQAGFEPEDVAAALEDLERVGLIDDDRFARALVAARTIRRPSGDRDLRSALRQKGVPEETAEAAVAAAGNELDRARALAMRRAGRFRNLAPEAAVRRLHDLLLRRGFAPGVARQACREALAEAVEGIPGAHDRGDEG